MLIAMCDRSRGPAGRLPKRSRPRRFTVPDRPPSLLPCHAQAAEGTCYPCSSKSSNLFGIHPSDDSTRLTSSDSPQGPRSNRGRATSEHHGPEHNSS